jgi:hypothetical protein
MLNLVSNRKLLHGSCRSQKEKIWDEGIGPSVAPIKIPSRDVLWSSNVLTQKSTQRHPQFLNSS